MPLRLILATRNRHKVEEVHRILAATQYEVDIIGLDAYPDVRAAGVDPLAHFDRRTRHRG